MFVTKQGTAAARNIEYRLADELATEIAADAKSVAAIAHDAGITQSDLLQFLGGSTEPYTKHQARVSLEFAATVSRGLTDPSLVDIPLVDFSVTTPGDDVNDGEVDDPYSDYVVFNNAASRTSWRVSRGAFPPGLTILPGSGSEQNRGLITGTPEIAGDYSFTLEGTDDAGLKRTLALTISIAEASS